MKFFVVSLVLLSLVFPGRVDAVPWSRVMNCPQGKLRSRDRARAERLMKSINNYHGCSDTVANCLKKDPKNQTARRVAGMICRMVVQDRSDGVIKKEVMYRARSMHPFRKHKIKLHRSQCTMDPKKAKVVVTSFTDFSCPYCRVVLPFLKRIADRSNSDVALCFKHFPTQTHGKDAVMGSQASVAADRQGKFWEYFDVLYSNRDHGTSQLIKYARDVGLDVARFRKDLNSRAVRRFVAVDKQEGLNMKVKGTPTIYLNGKEYLGRKDNAEVRDRIEEELHLVSGGQ